MINDEKKLEIPHDDATDKLLQQKLHNKFSEKTVIDGMH
jgi:hypothetical protein